MVKGISKQVIVVRPVDQKLFEQAIFILKDDAEAVSDEVLLKEARSLIRDKGTYRRRMSNPLWAFGGAAVTGVVWLLTRFL